MGHCVSSKRDLAQKKTYLASLVLLFILAGCATTPTATEPAATPTGMAAVATATLTATTQPATPTPTAIAQPATPTPTATAQPTVTAAPVSSPTASGASMTLEPDTGPPGTKVQASGYLPGGPSAQDAKGNFEFQTADVCWGECPGGLSEQALSVQWSESQPGHFTFEFTVPSIPWLGADGPHPLVPGDYTVGAQCLAPTSPGCLLRGPQAVAVFHLTGPTPAECEAGPCGHLELDPSEGTAGTLVQVGGWAPLTEVISEPFGYSLILETSQAQFPPQIGSVQQALNGDLSGSFRIPLAVPALGSLEPGHYTLALEAVFPGVGSSQISASPGVTITPLPKSEGVRITLAPTTLTVAPSPAWSFLGEVRPVLVQESARLYAPPAVAVDPADPQRIAYCTPGQIQLSTNGGTSWSAVSTQGVISATEPTSYTLFAPGSEQEPACHSVTLDPGHPQSFYVAFETAIRQYGAPPIFFMGYVTADGGQTWQLVPPPQGYEIDQFGGFRAGQGSVQAIFSGPMSSPEQAPPFAVERTTDGGQTWTPGQLACPLSGSCIHWGAAPAQIGGMGVGYTQAIEISTDGGQTWATPTWPANVILNTGPSELAALSSSTVALLSGQGDYPFLLSEDAGQTWKVILLPPMIGNEENQPPLYPGLQMLPNGALLSRPQAEGTWQMLLPGASGWCPVTGVSLPAAPDLMTVIGSQLWWLESPEASAAAPVIKSLPLSSLQCD